VFDPRFKIYFFFNKINGQSQWKLPNYVDLFNDTDDKMTQRIQRMIRIFIAKMKVRHIVHAKYTRFYDASVNRFYFMNNDTQVLSTIMILLLLLLPPSLL